jgi:hypothetical protein
MLEVWASQGGASPPFFIWGLCMRLGLDFCMDTIVTLETKKELATLLAPWKEQRGACRLYCAVAAILRYF